MASPTIGPREPLPPPPASKRARLAALAMNAALSAEGAVAGHPGPLGLHVTATPGGPIAGVAAVARPDGRYDVALRLVAEPVPLHELAAHVRALVLQWANRDALSAAVGSIDVTFEDVVARMPLEPPTDGTI